MLPNIKPRQYHCRILLFICSTVFLIYATMLIMEMHYKRQKYYRLLEYNKDTNNLALGVEHVFKIANHSSVLLAKLATVHNKIVTDIKKSQLRPNKNHNVS